MKLREWANRALNGNLNGVVLRATPEFQADLPQPQALRFWSPARSTDIPRDPTLHGAAWFAPPETWPNGKLTIVEMDWGALLDFDVTGHAGVDPAVYDGDEVLVDVARYYGPGPSPCKQFCRVLSVKEGDASPYPFVVRLAHGGMGQYKREEILAVRRKPLDLPEEAMA